MDTDTITTIKLNGIFLWPYVQVSLQWQLWIVDQCGFNPSAVDSILQLWIVDHFNPITGDNAHKVKPSGLLSHTHKFTPTKEDRAKYRSFFPLSSRHSLSSFFIKLFILHSPRVFSKYIFATDSDLLKFEGIPIGWENWDIGEFCVKTWVIGILSFFRSFFHSFGWRGRRWLRDLVGVGPGPVA